MKTMVVTDSTCDLPAELAAELGISVVANTIVMDGEDYEDGKGLSREEFYNRLPRLKEQPTTATASPGIYEALYQKLFDEGADEIISLHVSANLSGVYNAAALGSSRFNGRVQTFDSQMISMGLGYMAQRAAEAASAGLNARQVLEQVQQFKERVHLVAMLDTLEFVRRSGRVSWAKARLGGLLGLRPFLEVKNGQVNSLGEARTRGKGVERLVNMLLELGPLERLSVLHTNGAQDARAFFETVKDRLHLQQNPLFINVTTVIGTHVGPGALGFVAVLKA